MALNENAQNVDSANTGSQNQTQSSSEMKKPWMKTLGKEYWQNEDLAQYDSLGDAIGSLLKRPKAKEVPDSYGYGDADELFKKGGLTKEEADSIEAYYQKKIPARSTQKEIFGEEFDTQNRLYSKAVDALGKDLSEDIRNNGLDKDPTFVKMMARVGKELGGATFNSSSKDGQPTQVDYIHNIIEKNFGKK
jgi:hypothetical protein